MMKIHSTSEEALVRRTTTIDWIGCKYVVIDYLNDRGRIVDTVYRDEDGNELDNESASTIEQLEVFMSGPRNK